MKNKKINKKKLEELLKQSQRINRLIALNAIEDLASHGHYAKGIISWLKEDILYG